MAGYTFILKSRLRAIIYQVKRKPIRSVPGFVNSLAITVEKVGLLFFFAVCAKVEITGASLPVFEMSNNLRLKEGAKNRMTIQRLANGNTNAQVAAQYSNTVPCKLYNTLQAAANQ